MFVMILQMTLFFGIQVGAIVMTFKYVNHRNRRVFDDFHHRLTRIHQKQIQQRNLFKSLELQLEKYGSLTDTNQSSNVSKLG